LQGALIIQVVTALIVCTIILIMRRNYPHDFLLNCGIAILFAGIIGNLFDRLYYGYVIDFLSFTLFGNSMPIFNFADT